MSGPKGLEEAEAVRRLAEYGANEVEKIAGKPLALTFAREFVNFFAVILWVAAGLAFFAEWRRTGRRNGNPGERDYRSDPDQREFSFWQAYRAERALAALEKLLPRSTKGCALAWSASHPPPGLFRAM